MPHYRRLPKVGNPPDAMPIQLPVTLPQAALGSMGPLPNLLRCLPPLVKRSRTARVSGARRRRSSSLRHASGDPAHAVCQRECSWRILISVAKMSSAKRRGCIDPTVFRPPLLVRFAFACLVTGVAPGFTIPRLQRFDEVAVS